MPSSAKRQPEQGHRLEQSAYQSTSHRVSIYSTTTRIPTISTSSDLNKPLPQSPSGSEKRRRKPPSLRGFFRREPSSQLDSSHLQPGPYQQNQRYSASLPLDTHNRHYSRSMPSSPSHDSTTHPRAHSAASNYEDPIQYQPYSLPHHQQSTRPVPQRATSMCNYFDATAPPRSRTFPESTLSPTARENMSTKPRPQPACLSPTEPFTDLSQFHLFAEAMTGLPNDAEPFSPNGPPQLQGSLFARRTTNDTIPLPLKHPQQSSSTQATERPQRDDWQNFEPPPLVSSHSRPAPNHSLLRPESYQQWQPPPQMNEINAELELLGLDDEHNPDDELPDYKQSQAEMAARKRQEALARARELESRWRGMRGR
ncbi:hypothetical protein EJ02DRAFT_443399 [Clathrospora elynae]|uniref:Uncharacterized protein n=1 Tax=Clathrospora elynae TaxID=706981 RepID=A0A6A5SRQ2_9PLEO|nr:hypothetical protein EJ02DRAFT_443399 [Clathrospora elynae]